MLFRIKTINRRVSVASTTQMGNKKMAKPIQDFYPDELAHCYGCGRLNPQGLQIKSYWDGTKAVASFTPRAYHTAIPGFVYGGLIASLIDCHGTGTAAAAAYAAQGRPPGSKPHLRFVTASLKVDYLKPTPIDKVLVLTARPVEIKGRKVVVDVELLADSEKCAIGRVVAVQLPEEWTPAGSSPGQ